IYSGSTGQADEEKVVAYLERVLKLDATFAPAWALLSRAHSSLASNYIPSPQEWDEARRTARQALALDPKLPDAHNAMARINILYDWDWVGGQAQVQQALALDPGSALAVSWAGHLALFMGHTDQALDRKSTRLN